MKLKNIATIVLISGATAVGSVFAYDHYFAKHEDIYLTDSNRMPAHYVSYNSSEAADAVDFSPAASVVIPATVHIKTKTPPREVSAGHSQQDPFGGMFGNPFSDFFGGGSGGHYYRPGQMASGSGVIIAEDGYIVTNNHVIDGAREIAVTLNNNKTYKAKIVGQDPNTDLAVIKIDAKDLPYIVFGNSDQTKVGQWVLACGYPLNLQSTVTSGIISAKSRKLGINDEGINPIESYIQTDAAVNPGNSGGPLVDTQGRLVGINSAIASPTGSFAGYAYAVPSNLVKKVVNDILKYGTVQRAYLGIQLQQPNPSKAYQISYNGNSNEPEGVKVDEVTSNGGAVSAGLRKGDLITKIDDQEVHTQNELLSVIANYRPGNVVKVSYTRDGKEYTTRVTLKNENGTTDIVKAGILDVLGADFRELPEKYAQKLGISGGVVVVNIGSGLIRQQTDMHPDFIILKAGSTLIKSVDDLKEALQKQGNNVVLQGFYIGEDGVSDIYSYALNNVKGSIVN
ncbi:S1C family serine protease [Compostibacter hankyongensis]